MTTNAPAPTAEPAGGKTSEPGTPSTPAQPTPPADKNRLPDDHPLVTALAAVKSELADTRSKLKTFEDANKSEIDKATEQVATQTDRAEKAEARAARFEAAVKYSLTADDLELLDGVPADKVDERAKKLAERLGDRKKNNNVVPKEGATTTTAPTDERTFVREFFGKGG